MIDPQTIWFKILEKSFAKIVGSYKKIHTKYSFYKMGFRAPNVQLKNLDDERQNEIWKIVFIDQIKNKGWTCMVAGHGHVQSIIYATYIKGHKLVLFHNTVIKLVHHWAEIFNSYKSEIENEEEYIETLEKFTVTKKGRQQFAFLLIIKI